MSIQVTHTLHDLADDLEKIPTAHGRGMRDVVNDVAEDGNRWAKGDAADKAGKVGRHYPDAFRVDEAAPSLTSWTAEYGPISALPQGDMDFEKGSGRQTAPHNSLALSADLYGPELAARTRSHLSDLFWIGG